MSTAELWTIALAIVGTLGTLIIAAAGWLTYLHGLRSHRQTEEQRTAADFRTALDRRFREADEAVARRQEALKDRFKERDDEVAAITAQMHGLQLELARNYITRVDIILAMERMGARLEGTVNTVNGKLDVQSRDLNSKVDRLVFNFNRLKPNNNNGGTGQ